MLRGHAIAIFLHHNIQSLFEPVVEKRKLCNQRGVDAVFVRGASGPRQDNLLDGIVERFDITGIDGRSGFATVGVKPRVHEFWGRDRVPRQDKPCVSAAATHT